MNRPKIASPKIASMTLVLMLLTLGAGAPQAAAMPREAQPSDSPVLVKDSEGTTLPRFGRKKKKEEEKKPEGTPAAAPGKKEDPPFEEVVKDFARADGLFPVYQKDGRFLMEIRPEQLDKDYMLSLTRETGIGEMGILAAQVLGESPVRLTRVGKRVQLLMRNSHFSATDDPDVSRAVSRSFSDSLAGSAKIESAPHPQSKAILVEMAPYFLGDVEGLGIFLGMRQTPYNADRENSYLGGVKGSGSGLEIDARVHFSGSRPAPLANLPDSRSFFVQYRYSLTVPVASPDFIPRLADDRVGHFLALYQDFSDDRRESPWVRYITRWNLQKEEPYAAMSKPKQPITFWLENSIPKQYRKAVADGVLVWNKAFEKIGFTDAVVVKQQPDDADWDPADTTHSTIRWFVATDSSFAIGPSRINPRTGEIYDADISMTESTVSFARREFQNEVDPIQTLRALTASMAPAGEIPGGAAGALGPEPTGLLTGGDPRFQCRYGLGAALEASYGYSFLRAAGMQPGSPEEDAYINAFITHVIAHEVGHTLGLRHNYRASGVQPVDQLQNAARTQEQGLTGSVMDYIPVNLAAPGTRQGQYWQTSLGAYDHWAIEYAYSVFPGVKSSAEELSHLKPIAEKVAQPGLLYGTDEDWPDPATSQWDIGADSLAWYSGRLQATRQLWKEIPGKLARNGDGYQVMRRAFQDGLFQFLPASLNTAKYIGGLRSYRDHVGDPGGRLPFVPVAAERQREALRLLRENLFSEKSFDLPSDLMNRLAATRWYDFSFSIFAIPRMEFPLHDMVLFMQQVTLNQLYSPARLDRLVDLEMHYAPGEKAFTLVEMFDSLHDAIWSELSAGSAVKVGSFRRALQREHLKRLVDLLLRAPGEVPEDARSVARANLSELKGRIDTVLKGAGLDATTRAHLDETRARVEAALSAHALRLTS